MDEGTLRHMWGTLALRGVVSVIFGIAAVFWPGLTLKTLVYLFGAFILVSGLLNMVSGLANLNQEDGSFWMRLLGVVLGFAELAVGVYLLRHPTVTFTTLILIIGLTLIVLGVLELFAGIFNAGSATYKTVMLFGGLIGVLAGILLLFQPVASGVAFVWILGLYALISGPLLIAMALDAKRAAEALAAGTRRPRTARAR